MIPTISISQVKRMVVFLPNWVGDAVMATPALRALRQRFSNAKISYFARPAPLAVIDGTHLADKMIEDTSRRKPKMKNLREMTKILRAGRFDLAVLLPNSFRSAMTAKLSSIKRIAGYCRHGRGWMITEKFFAPKDDRGKFKPTPAIDYYLALAEGLGARCDDRTMELSVTQAGEKLAEEMLNDAAIDPARPLVMLNPGGSFGPSKLWAKEKFARTADELIRDMDAQIIINAAPGPEREIAMEVENQMKQSPMINLANQQNSLALVKSITARCNLVITNDTGARHIAAAMGTGVVTIFGSTDPQRTIINCPNEKIIRADVECSPCQKKVCPKPAGVDFGRCLAEVTVEMVVSAAREIIAGQSSGGNKQ